MAEVWSPAHNRYLLVGLRSKCSRCPVYDQRVDAAAVQASGGAFQAQNELMRTGAPAGGGFGALGEGGEDPAAAASFGQPLGNAFG